MDLILFDFFDIALSPTPTSHQPCQSEKTPSPLHPFFHAFTSCLPRRINEPTDIPSILLDMLLSNFVQHGLSQSLINALPTETVCSPSNPHQSPSDSHLSSPHKCAICLAPYQPRETVRRLPCNHPFHAQCVDLWLNKRNSCPICKAHAY
ncbi:RING finger protein 44 [Gracilariopsis chorda]|uniref:RING finger protein 44 n=1 Tax=Gracilariopsis chorda TaxID=448386 RepID=A0A2V3IFI0_9FLOR|nr:RING finger protein 44 [Gracilariopsis chorda]|eukprot:PXF40793.1 RING finger protein 44 [Gracilariopsis chorda]